MNSHSVMRFALIGSIPCVCLVAPIPTVAAPDASPEYTIEVLLDRANYCLYFPRLESAAHWAGIALAHCDEYGFSQDNWRRRRAERIIDFVESIDTNERRLAVKAYFDQLHVYKQRRQHGDPQTEKAMCDRYYRLLERMPEFFRGTPLESSVVRYSILITDSISFDSQKQHQLRQRQCRVQKEIGGEDIEYAGALVNLSNILVGSTAPNGSAATADKAYSIIHRANPICGRYKADFFALMELASWVRDEQTVARAYNEATGAYYGCYTIPSVPNAGGRLQYESRASNLALARNDLAFLHLQAMDYKQRVSGIGHPWLQEIVQETIDVNFMRVLIETGQADVAKKYVIIRRSQSGRARFRLTYFDALLSCGEYEQVLREMVKEQPVFKPTQTSDFVSRPDYITTFLQTALALHRLGRWTEAIAAYEEALEERQKYLPAEAFPTQRAEILTGLADVLLSVGRRDEAMRHLTEAFGILKAKQYEDHPKWGRASRVLGDLHAQSERPADAIKAWQDALRAWAVGTGGVITPDYLDLLDRLSKQTLDAALAARASQRLGHYRERLEQTHQHNLRQVAAVEVKYSRYPNWLLPRLDPGDVPQPTARKPIRLRYTFADTAEVVAKWRSIQPAWRHAPWEPTSTPVSKEP